MDSGLSLEWDGEEKRHAPGFNEHMLGLRRDVGELKLAMSKVATALEKLAVLEESHTNTRILTVANQGKFETHLKEFNDLERRVAFFRGAIWFLSSIITLGAGGVGYSLVRGFDALTEAHVHLQTDRIQTQRDVMDAIRYYKDQQKGMN